MLRALALARARPLLGGGRLGQRALLARALASVNASRARGCWRTTRTTAALLRAVRGAAGGPRALAARVRSRSRPRAASRPTRRRPARGAPAGSWVVAVAGSSVTAGHDGFGRPRGPPCSAPRSRRTPRARRGLRRAERRGRRTDPNPWPALCVAPSLGEDADVVVREWRTGVSARARPTRPVARARARRRRPGASRASEQRRAALELWLRSLWRLPRQPAAHFLQLDTGVSASAKGGGEARRRGATCSGSRPPTSRSRAPAARAVRERKRLPLPGLRRSPPFEGLRAAAPPFEQRCAQRQTGRQALREGRREQRRRVPRQLRAPGRLPRARRVPRHGPMRSVAHAERPRRRRRRAAAAAAARGRVRSRQPQPLCELAPAPLGHEVIDHQLADYHLGVLADALAALVDALARGGGAALAPLLARAPRAAARPAARGARAICGGAGRGATCAHAYRPPSRGRARRAPGGGTRPGRPAAAAAARAGARRGERRPAPGLRRAAARGQLRGRARRDQARRARPSSAARRASTARARARTPTRSAACATTRRGPFAAAPAAARAARGVAWLGEPGYG